MNLLASWTAWNKRVCNAIEERLPEAFTRSFLHQHELIVAKQLRAHSNAVLLDVGGGSQTPFASHRIPGTGNWVVGVDIAEALLRKNRALDARVAADACLGLPFRSECVEIIVTRSVMEHLPDNARFLAECRRVLKRGGLAICVMPGRRAPFALLNRVLPESLKRKLLFTFFPEWRDDCGFSAYYDRCAWPEMGNEFAAAGFRVERVEFGYYQSTYFRILVPVYLLSVIYDLVVWRLSARWLCSRMLIVARRI
jgi:SAM-dependent methyltransferase